MVLLPWNFVFGRGHQEHTRVWRVWKTTDKQAFLAGMKVPWRNGGQEGQIVAAGLGFDILHSIRQGQSPGGGQERMAAHCRCKNMLIR